MRIVTADQATANPLSSKTVIGAITWAIGWIIDSGIVPDDWRPLARPLGDVIIAVGALITAYGVWHGQQKVKQTIALNNPSGSQQVVK